MVRDSPSTLITYTFKPRIHKWLNHGSTGFLRKGPGRPLLRTSPPPGTDMLLVAHCAVTQSRCITLLAVPSPQRAARTRPRHKALIGQGFKPSCRSGLQGNSPRTSSFAQTDEGAAPASRSAAPWQSLNSTCAQSGRGLRVRLPHGRHRRLQHVRPVRPVGASLAVHHERGSYGAVCTHGHVHR